MESRSLLISDLDGTLLGSTAGLAQFADWYAARSERLWLVYNSGRFVNSIAESIEHTALPAPHAVIGGVGTEIELAPWGTPLAGWSDLFGTWNAAAIRSAVLVHKELELQPDEFQSQFKLSFFGHKLSPKFLKLLQSQLDMLGHRVNLVYSSERDLDVLPAKADKGTAAAFLAAHWKIPAERVFVSGDSANDAAMFRHGFRGIVVGNGHAELKAMQDPFIYKAAGAYAWGVLEGLEYWRA